MATAKSKSDPNYKVIAENRRARFDYAIEDDLEVGIMLQGSEVKSLRLGGSNIAESYANVEGGELWLINGYIAPYEQANRQNHEPRRRRKLLLHGMEIYRWNRKVREGGLTSVPLRMYFKGSLVKMEIALVRGKQAHDKRAALRDKQDQREMRRAMRAETKD